MRRARLTEEFFLPDTGWKVEVLMPGSWRGATSVLLSQGQHHLVVDTGLPHEAHQLVRSLERKGLRPEDVEVVVNTHFHVDHVLNNCLFPRAAIYATQESYDWCCSLYSDLRDDRNWEQLSLKYYPELLDYEEARQRMAGLRKFALRWWKAERLGERSRFHWMETEGLPDALDFLVTAGHVPGHVSILAPSQGSTTVIAGDALLTREDDQQVLTMIPCNREQFARDRERILSLGGIIVPGHDHQFSTPSNAAANSREEKTGAKDPQSR